MKIDRCFSLLAAVFAVSLCVSPAFAGSAFTASDGAVDGAVNLVYDPSDGSLSLSADGDFQLTTTTLESANGAFNTGVAPATSPPFDQNTASKFFKLSAPPSAVSSLEFGAGYLPTGLDSDGLIAEVSWNGSISPAGSWTAAPGGGPYASVIPEPTSLALALAGMLGVFVLRRK